jgi:hypothetical protein
MAPEAVHYRRFNAIVADAIKSLQSAATFADRHGMAGRKIAIDAVVSLLWFIDREAKQENAGDESARPDPRTSGA